MFIDNKYTRWYYSIIRNSRNNTDTYVERHHIIPKAIGGTNDFFNISILTPKQHFICHWLLTKMVEEKNRNKMLYAFWSMTRKNSNHQRTITSAQYDVARKQVSKVRKGKSYEQIYGVEKSKQIKQKISKVHKGLIKPNCIENLKNRALTTYYWQITHPCGKIEIIENMSQFCRQHNLSPGNMTSGKSKGYVAVKLKRARNQKYTP